MRWFPCALLIALAYFPFFLSTTMLPDGFAEEAHRVRLIGHCDLQGRDALQIVLKGNYAYVGHHRGEAFNPLTGRKEPNGTTIVDVSNPAQPKIVKHIPGYPGAESRAVQVAEKFFDGKDYLLRNQESGEFTGFEVWEISNRSQPKRIATIGPMLAAHKSWWDPKTGLAYLSGTLSGWRGQHLIIYDLKNPQHPKFIASWGLPGQRPQDRPTRRLSLHHPVVSGNRAYLSYLFGGDVVILDISNPQDLRVIAHLNFSPPFSGTHTTVPFLKMKVPNFTEGIGDIRDFLVIAEESLAANCQELRRQLYIVDITEESRPIPVATFKVPDGDFCSRPGRFGPHQFAETKDGEIIGGKLLFIAYFNAGMRVVDISDPFRPREVGYYVPQTPPGKRMIQTNDVDLDARGLIYITDRAGAGMHILEYTP